MKAKHAIILFVFGYGLDFIGSLLKIMHSRGGDAILVVAVILKISGALVFLIKLTSYPKYKEFLNT